MQASALSPDALCVRLSPRAMNAAGEFSATRVDVLTDREAEWSARMDMVSHARRFLILTTYYFGSDARSISMAQALTTAAHRGVRVVLVIDRFGHRLASNMDKPGARPRLLARLRDLEAAGGRVVFSTPRSFRHRLVGGGNHVKIQISDAGAAIFGSSNLAEQSFAHWNELSLRVEGPIAAHLLQEACVFAELPPEEIATLAHQFVVEPASSARSSCQVRYVREDPEDRAGRFFPFGTVRNRLTDELVRFIDGARHSLCISSLYCKPAQVLKDAILRACRRGVVVEIFHSHRDSLGVSHVPWISASIQYASLLKEGVRIYENRAGEHAKVLLADGRRVAVGSYNLEHAAHDRLIEAMIFSDDDQLCGQLRALFQALRRRPDNVALTSRWHRDLPLQLQVKRWLFRPLQRWI